MIGNGGLITAAERLNRLRLARSENVGPVTFRQLLKRYASAAEALEALPELARRGGRRAPIRIHPREAAERELAAIEAFGARLIALGESDYPTALAAIDDPAPLITVKGHPHLLTRPCAAIIGGRNASLNGRRLAQTIAKEAGAAGFVIVSGLARGIDAAAHRGALESGTVAVMAGGIDALYPPEHQALYEEIGEAGALVAELPFGTQPQARHFPRRNRLISGLSLGVLVVEAALRSGSLITARLALEQGREVLAVPGSPLDPRARGCNALLRQGAVLVESAADLIEALSGSAVAREPERPAYEAPAALEASEESLAAVRRVLTELLGPTPASVDELIRECQLSPALVVTVILELELAGRLERHPGNRVSLTVTEPATSG